MDDAARIPIVLAAIALAGITALLASGFSADARDSTPVCAWRRAIPGFSPAGFGTAHRQPGLPYEHSNILVQGMRLLTGGAMKIGNTSRWRTHQRETGEI